MHIVIAALLVLAQPHVEPLPAQPPVSTEEVANLDPVALRFFDESLKDPVSAIIQRAGGGRRSAIETGGGLFGPKKQIIAATAVCYRVNAKNSYGGYVGLRTYLLLFVGKTVGQVMTSPYAGYAGNLYPVERVESECANEQELTNLRGAPPASTLSDASLLTLIANGECGRARDLAVARSDGNALLQIEKLCRRSESK